MSKRYEQLDSLRGLAATVVVIFHLLMIVPSLDLVKKLENTPLRVFWGGHEAVILFFILSGFVLSLPYYSNTQNKYKDFLIRRIARIYVPYLASIIAAIACIFMFSRGGIPELSKWFNEAWLYRDLSLQQLLEHIIMLGDFKSNNLNSVIWSLVHEMRISILFPALMFVVVRLSWKKNMAISLGCSFVYFLAWIISYKLFSYSIVKINTSYVLTIHYIGLFILGAVLAKHREHICDLYKMLSNPFKIGLLLVGILAYSYSFWFLPNTFYLHYDFINDWAIAIGCSVFIVSSLASKTIGDLLVLKPIHFIGKISYSLYLFHMIVILSMFNLLFGKIPNNLILVISFVLSFVVASIAYYAIEKPSIILGRILTTKSIKINSLEKEKANKIA